MNTATIKTGSRRITIKTGSEGPRHDPYHYTEITVSGEGRPNVTYHEGLGVWLTYNGQRIERDELALRFLFERHLGCSFEAFDKACHRLHSICRKCGARASHQESGYPGETFTVCENGHIMHCHFNESAVM